MSGWKRFCGKAADREVGLEYLMAIARENFKYYGVYPDSIHIAGEACIFIARYDERKVLVVYGQGDFFDEFKGDEFTEGGSKGKVCELSNDNCRIIRRLFPFTNPVNHRGKEITVGLGDRLGLASAGHIRLLRGKSVFPVLSQQSIRELNLTGRTYDDVLSAASWAVFQEGCTTGFGADGDHLKTAEEVKMAIDCGFTMITLDCSDHIDNKVVSLTADEIERKYADLKDRETLDLETKYTGKNFDLGSGLIITFTPEEFKKIMLIYMRAINHTIEIYNNVIKNCGRNIDFEMSIDETLTSTTPESHFFVASELIAAGVEITSLAPRFCGEFQKGIDYRGNIAQFSSEFEMHVKIADYFGYKISVHSGSDKFSIFPVIGEKSGGRFHLKTAGTNWLEAVRIICLKNPSLYRRMHKFAVQNLQEARKYYHISAQVEKVPDIDKLQDEELPSLMDMEDSRQVLHITYGLILQARNSDNSSSFRDEIYDTLNRHEDEYYMALQKHIGKHLLMLLHN